MLSFCYHSNDVRYGMIEKKVLLTVSWVVSMIGSGNWARSELEIHVMNLIWYNFSFFFFFFRTRTKQILLFFPYPLKWESFSIYRSCAYFGVSVSNKKKCWKRKFLFFIVMVCWWWPVVPTKLTLRYVDNAVFLFLHLVNYSIFLIPIEMANGGWVRATLIIIKVEEFEENGTDTQCHAVAVVLVNA